MPKIAVPVQSAVGESAKPIAHRESVAPTKPILNSWMLVKCRDRMKPLNLVIVNGTSAPCCAGSAVPCTATERERCTHNSRS